MNLKKLTLSTLFLLPSLTFALPANFVYLKNIAPTIQQEIRYATFHNFIGRPIAGYTKNTECILTKPAALALAEVQKSLKQKHLSLKVYDCYRPQKAVDDFIQWSSDPSTQQMKAEFYPNVNKADVFELGYVAKKSGHSRGSTMDLTIVPLPTPKEAHYHPGQKLIACTAPLDERFRDNSIEMGTGYDCLDERAHFDNQDVTHTAQQNRQFLQQVMMQNGFLPYDKEWWHFTLKNEPYPDTYFNF